MLYGRSLQKFHRRPVFSSNANHNGLTLLESHQRCSRGVCTNVAELHQGLVNAIPSNIGGLDDLDPSGVLGAGFEFTILCKNCINGGSERFPSLRYRFSLLSNYTQRTND